MCLRKERKRKVARDQSITESHANLEDCFDLEDISLSKVLGRV